MLMHFFILFTSVNSFLLNQQGNGGQTSPANQYMTLSKFMEEEKRLQQKMENLQQDTTLLRHDMDNSFIVLSDQLQQKLDLLDQKIADIDKNNVTNQDVLKLMEKHKVLEENYNKLQTENTVLQNKYNQVENELQLVKNKTEYLDELQKGLCNDVRTNFSILGRESTVLRNKSILVDQEISNLKQLGSIQPLKEIKTLQQTVQVISTQTNTLRMKERARGQDFLALYNMTTNSLNELDVRTQSKFQQVETDVDQRVDTLTNETRFAQNSIGIHLNNIHKNQSDFALKIREIEHREHLKFSDLQKQINDSTELVAMTAQLKSSSPKTSGILKFDNVRFSIGISNLAAYKSTGKFVCERKGLYMISSSIMAKRNGASYYIYLNGQEMSETYISYATSNPSDIYHTGTVVFTLQLLPNDSVWIHNPGYEMSGALHSTLTIVKVK